MYIFYCFHIFFCFFSNCEGVLGGWLVGKIVSVLKTKIVNS